MKKNIKVYVTDGSYAMLKRGKLFTEMQSVSGIALMGETWTVKDINKKLIADNSTSESLGKDKKEWNDTIIIGDKTNREVYIQERFLKAA